MEEDKSTAFVNKEAPKEGESVQVSAQTSTSPAPTSPASTPSAPAPAPTTPTTPTATPATVPNLPPNPNVVPKPKSKKLPIIIASSVCGALAIGGGVFAIIHNTPEKIAADAIAGVIQAKTITVDGNIDVSYANNTDEDDGKNYIKSPESSNFFSATNVKIKGGKDGSNQSAEAKISFSGEDGKELGKTLKIKEIATGDNGTLYLKADGIKDVLSGIFGPVFSAAGAGSVDLEDLLDESSGASYASSILSSIVGLINKIDGNWLSISIDDGLKYYFEDNEQEYDSAIGTCVNNEIKDFLNSGDRIADSYRKNPFVSVQKSDAKNFEKGDDYTVTFSTEKLASFINALDFKSRVNNVKSCLESNGMSNMKTSDLPDVTADDANQLIKDLPELHFGISGWEHKLTGVAFIYSNKDSEMKYSVKLNLDYPKEFKISAPKDSKPFVDILDKLSPNQSQSQTGSVTDCDGANATKDTKCMTRGATDELNTKELFEEYEETDDDDDYDDDDWTQLNET